MDDPDLAYLHAKKMMAAAGQLSMGMGSSSGTTPNSLSSTPVSLYPQPMHMQYLQSAQFANQMQLQQPISSTYEGLPIFIVPQNGMCPQVTVGALQRATEIRTALAINQQEPKIDTSKHSHIFVGDLSPEISNVDLKDAFSVYGEVSEAKVIRDSQTQKSKGYGFVSFPKQEEAEKARVAMNGQWLGRRAIRTNWATRRPADEARDKLTFEQVFNSTKPDNTSVYVGNVHPTTVEADLREPFAAFGEVTDVRIFKAQGYAFVRFEKKECATNAIMEMNGKEIGGNVVRCSWGRTQQQSGTATIVPDLPLLNPALIQNQVAAAMPNLYFNPYYQQLYNPTIIPQYM